MKPSRLPQWTWLAALVAAAILLRVAVLGRDDLWADEIQTLHTVALGWGDLVADRLRAGHPPAYFLAMKAWCALFGTSQTALRLPSAIAGAAVLVPAHSLIRRLAGDAPARWGAALVAVHPLFVELSREARMYSFLALAAFVAAAGAAAALDGKRPGISFWTAIALGPAIHPTWGLAVLPLAAWLALERRGLDADRRRASNVALVGLAASLVLLVALVSVSHAQHQELTRRPWPREIGVFLFRIVAGSELGAFRTWLACFCYAVTWAFALLLGLLHSTPRVRRLALWWGLGVPVASVAAGLGATVPGGPARYVLWGGGGAIVLVAAAASPGATRLARLALLVFVAAVLCVWQIAVPDTAWSDAAARLAGDTAPVVVGDESSRIVLAHYLGRDVSVGVPPAGAAAWWRATLVADESPRRVELTREPGPR